MTATVIDTTIANRLFQLRQERDMRQADIAAAVGTGANRISDWEQGKHEPGLSSLRALAGLFGMTLSELLDGVE